jgi:tryptophan 2-C-methyltransferase
MKSLTLVNTNRMLPPIAPIGLDYIASAVRQAGGWVELVDLCLAEDRETELDRYFAARQPDLVGLTFRNVDDCFWPSAQSFMPTLLADVAAVRRRTDAPIVLGGVGYSVFPRRILEATGADFGIHGDGETALIQLLHQIRGQRCWERVDGLLFHRDGGVIANPPAWPQQISVTPGRDLVDNATYFRRGGQIGIETKRGCQRRCIYCVDPVAKGNRYRCRAPAEVAQEFVTLCAAGIDVIHLCDAEFNLPARHAEQVCDALIERGLGDRVRWYAYLAVVPLPESLIRRMRRAGCVGINFTSDAAHPDMLANYAHAHRLGNLEHAVRVCRKHGIAVMLDMLLGGPGETPETLAETIRAFKQLDPDCAGAALGVRVYPGTPLASLLMEAGPWEFNRNLRRRDTGPVDLLQPVFYLSSHLGEQPASLVRELIGDDPRFFPPDEDLPIESSPKNGGHNYNQNQALIDAISSGYRGAYWDILRTVRQSVAVTPQNRSNRYE